jgi:hypothetical protein
LTAMERFWYVIENIALGAGYFAKLPAAKAFDEVYGTHEVDGMARFWYVLFNILPPGGMYLAKVPVKRALEQLRTANIPQRAAR